MISGLKLTLLMLQTGCSPIIATTFMSNLSLLPQKSSHSRIIRLEDGLGNGDFKLPDSIKSGRYKIRAYTNYMRNFSDQLFFSKEIIVVNSTDEKDKITDEVKYVENKIRLSFFPEGGSLDR